MNVFEKCIQRANENCKSFLKWMRLPLQSPLRWECLLDPLIKTCLRNLKDNLVQVSVKTRCFCLSRVFDANWENDGSKKVRTGSKNFQFSVLKKCTWKCPSYKFIMKYFFMQLFKCFQSKCLSISRESYDFGLQSHEGSSR